MDTKNKKYYIIIEHDPTNLNIIDKHQNKINLFISLATFILSIITATLTIKISYEAKELQVITNLPNFYVESSFFTSNNYSYSKIKLLNMGGIIKNATCSVWDVIEIHSDDKNYNNVNFRLGNNYTDDLEQIIFKYNSTQKAFIFQEDSSSIPTNQFTDLFNEYTKNDSIYLQCHYVTYLEIIYNDFRNNLRKEYYIMKNDQLYPINEEEFNTVLNYEELHSFLYGDILDENYYIKKILSYCKKY